MRPELWYRAEELFHAALEQRPAVRQAFLDTACGEDAELRRQVDLLVVAHEEAGSFLDRVGVADLRESVRVDELLVGREFGHYRIMSRLGEGGMGEVYRAHDTKLARDVALKALPNEFARNHERIARFRREARTLAALNHPHIAAIYGLEEFDGASFLVLELVEGRHPSGPVSIPEVLRIGEQIADALAIAHERGIIHRDLKPANVMVTVDGQVKLLDFGLAKAVYGAEGDAPVPSESTTAVASVAGLAIGTPAYMSPEQARGERVDQRTDVWSFGCLLYELLIGERAFRGETVQETLTAVLVRDPDWQALPARTPAKIRDLLRRCLRKDVSERLGAIAEARNIIEQAKAQPNRWRAAVVTTLVLALAAVSVAWLRHAPGPTDSSQWVQLTKFSDSVTQPALSPDGSIVAFIRGESTFFGPGQIYVKALPDGTPVQLTQDSLPKMSPAFSPDGTLVAREEARPRSI